VFDPAFEGESLAKIRDMYPTIIPLTDKDQTNAGANVWSLNHDRLLSMAVSRSANERRS